eukprot:243947_1
MAGRAEANDAQPIMNDRQQAEVYQKLFQMGFHDENAADASTRFPNNMEHAINYAVQHEHQYQQQLPPRSSLIHIFHMAKDWVRSILKLPFYNWFTSGLFVLYASVNGIVFISTLFPHRTVLNVMMWMFMCSVICSVLVAIMWFKQYVWMVYKPSVRDMVITAVIAVVLMNTKQIWTNTDTIDKNAQNIDLNAQNIAKNAENIAKNKENIDLDRIAMMHTMQQLYGNLRERVDGLENGMKDMNEALVAKEQRWNATVNEMIQDRSSMWAKIDDTAANMWLGFGLIPITRSKFGLGCFVKDTLIQVDAFGTVKRIQDLNASDTIFNPDLSQTFKMLFFTQGPETGMLYQIVTSDSFQVTVTKTHPMKICHGEGQSMECENIAASNVFEGNWTQTSNGYQTIVKINQIPAHNVTVYNAWLDMLPNQPMIKRSIIANGIHTLDLYAQSINE